MTDFLEYRHYGACTNGDSAGGLRMRKLALLPVLGLLASPLVRFSHVNDPPMALCFF
jgi:hypothetical protein